MNQSELDQAVARATGESVRTIARMGFVPLTPIPARCQLPGIDPADRLRLLLPSEVDEEVFRKIASGSS